MEVSMTAEERERANAYKVGFLRKLAEIGVRPDEFMERVKKADFLDQVTGGAVGAGRDIIGGGIDLAGTGIKALGQAAILAPLLTGAATGTASAMLSSPSTEDIESLRKAEILNLYKRLTDEVKARMARKVMA
jgi:hypothetical protein